MRSFSEIQKFPGFRVLEGFQVGNGYSVGSVLSSDLAATGGPEYFGPLHAEITAASGGSTASLRHRPLANGRSIDLTGKQLGIWYEIQDLANLNAYQLDVGDDTLANRYRYEVLNDNQSRQFASDNELVFQTLNPIDGAATGSPDISNITGIQFRLSPLATGDVTLKQYGLCMFNQPQRPIITISADDALESQYTKLFPTMKKYGLRGTFYAPANLIGTVGRLTSKMVDEMREYGIEIGGHTPGNDDSVNTDAEQQELIRQQKRIARRTSTEEATFAYAGGEFGGSAQKYAERHFLGARTISQTTCETYPSADPHRQRVVNYITNAVTPATVTARLAEGIQHNALMHLAGFHDIVDSNADQTTKYLTTDMEAILEYISGLNADIMTVRETL